MVSDRKLAITTMITCGVALTGSLAFGVMGIGKGVGVSVRPGSNSTPTETATVKTPGPERTVIKWRTHTETETVAPPTETRTKLVTPAPKTVTETETKTVTSESPESTHDLGEGEPQPISSASFQLRISKNVDSGWKIREAARTWNRQTGCNLFSFGDGYSSNPIYVEESDISTGGVWYETKRTIYLLEDGTRTAEGISFHELGHVLGLSHRDVPGTAMFGGYMDPEDRPTKATSNEIGIAQKLNIGRC